ncbi:type IV pilus inner membrane component PilO [Ostreibacterium oceani]|uniref:Type 4a pilus biogenesis protein PilO n=1 Tax=Ostreibacterium oceani TaxID=2654998 RepID=A0A6N7F2M2_9GAMM|nr:type 4a pilus biogenesis protein PilO [Ostreibacterium oceani]MPV86116.1 type 4a pilus biogenesis protein PilO [Ostreibacterium oceani]
MAKKSNFSFNSLHTWPAALTLIIGLLIIALFVILAKQFLINPIVDEITSKEGQISTQKQEYKKNQEIIATLPQIRKEIVELEIVRDEAKKYLPTEISMPALIDNVYISARNNGIVFDKFTPERDIDREFYTIKPVSLNAEVGYVSMASFVEEVTTLERIMNVESVSFRANNSRGGRNAEFPRNENTPITMTAELRTYIFKDDEDSTSN